jgi:hypothetical protein
MYSVTPKLGRIGLDDNPTTAMVLQSFKSSLIGSAQGFALSGRATLMA